MAPEEAFNRGSGTGSKNKSRGNSKKARETRSEINSEEDPGQNFEPSLNPCSINNEDDIEKKCRKHKPFFKRKPNLAWYDLTPHVPELCVPIRRAMELFRSRKFHTR